MSVQFGQWSFDGRRADANSLSRIRQRLLPFCPDSQREYSHAGLYLFYGAFHTTLESRRETQPVVLRSGAVLLWDGRLDNRDELSSQLRNALPSSATDAEIVAAAYERWAEQALPKLIGDWALSLSIPKERIVLLAKDFVGTRHLYYAIGARLLTWSTVLDPLVLFCTGHPELEEEFAAGWLSFFPAMNLTPYRGIQSVPPAGFVRVRDGHPVVGSYWQFDHSKRIRYRGDGEYEEHFRLVFSEAVRRRLRSDTPVLAELSGGIDSSSIVCVANELLIQGNAETPRMDTLSYYDDSEPDWNERPYFTVVEEKLGRTGFHISIEHRGLELNYEAPSFAVSPASPRQEVCNKQFVRCMESQGNRALLSGTGGDEMMGGVPSPVPELADLVAQARFRDFMRRSFAWALAKRLPIHYVAVETLTAFLPRWTQTAKNPPEWITRRFIATYRPAFEGYETQLKVLGSLPSFQEYLSGLNVLRRQLACSALSSSPLYEKRYPYLDRDLLEFLFAIPRAQMLEPNRRRSLQRRSLAQTVPALVLDRNRKGFVTRNPMRAITADWNSVLSMCREMVSESLGIVDSGAFLKVLERARNGQEIPVVPVLRTLALEAWLQQLKRARILCFPAAGNRQPELARAAEVGS